MMTLTATVDQPTLTAQQRYQLCRQRFESLLAQAQAFTAATEIEKMRSVNAQLQLALEQERAAWADWEQALALSA